MAGRREATSEESRRILIAAAAEVIGERGYRKATLAEIADRAGISRGSIPWHFGNKEGLLTTVVEQVTDELRTRFGVTSPLDSAGIARALDGTVESLKSPQARLLITVMSEAIEDGSPLRPRYAQLHATIRDLIAQWVAPDALPAGVSREGWAATVLGAIMGIHVQWRIAPEAVDLEKAAAALRSLVLTGLVPVSQAGLERSRAGLPGATGPVR